MLHIGVVSLIPEILSGLQFGVTGRALEQHLAKLDIWNPRDWGIGASKQVDDSPYGGGPGMVMMYEPLHLAITEAKRNLPSDCKTIYLSPQGRAVKQNELNDISASKQSLLFVAGRYEGVDERIIDTHIDEEWSLGDYVLSGGELAAMVYIDALLRLLPGSLGHASSAAEDSFMNGLLDCPHYTRPAEIDGLKVPPVLMSGNHKDIARWRRMQALGKTSVKRQDLLEELILNKEDKQLLIDYKLENDICP